MRGLSVHDVAVAVGAGCIVAGAWRIGTSFGLMTLGVCILLGSASAVRARSG